MIASHSPTDPQASWWKGTAPVLTADLLRLRFGACEERADVFARQFPLGVILDADGLISAIERRGSRGVLWFWDNVLSFHQKTRIVNQLPQIEHPWRKLKFGPPDARRAVAQTIAAELRESGLVAK